MVRCPLDCAVPEVRRSSLKAADYPYLLLLIFPYTCCSCGTRFRRVPSSISAMVFALVVLVMLGYPAGFVLGGKDSDSRIIRGLYKPVTATMLMLRGTPAANVTQQGLLIEQTEPDSHVPMGQTIIYRQTADQQ